MTRDENARSELTGGRMKGRHEEGREGRGEEGNEGSGK